MIPNTNSIFRSSTLTATTPNFLKPKNGSNLFESQNSITKETSLESPKCFPVKTNPISQRNQIYSNVDQLMQLFIDQSQQLQGLFSRQSQELETCLLNRHHQQGFGERNQVSNAVLYRISSHLQMLYITQSEQLQMLFANQSKQMEALLFNRTQPIAPQHSIESPFKETPDSLFKVKSGSLFQENTANTFNPFASLKKKENDKEKKVETIFKQTNPFFVNKVVEKDKETTSHMLFSQPNPFMGNLILDKNKEIIVDKALSQSTNSLLK